MTPQNILLGANKDNEVVELVIIDRDRDKKRTIKLAASTFARLALNMMKLNAKKSGRFRMMMNGR